MRIHKEGKGVLATILLLFLIPLVVAILTGYCWIFTIAAFFFIFLLFCLCFFRFPNRPLKQIDGTVLSPADGEIVIIEEVEETEYLKERRIQVSVFMSVWNVHINWFPIGGEVEYFKHHQGKYLLAWHPKSSELNERTSIVVNNGKTRILFRQIAGYVARRIVCYAKVGKKFEQNQQVGFIKFGSRVDLFLPLDTEINVKIGDKVKGTETIIARLKK
ncbi:MAG: phosphatidylserine decarboxylase family protein [Prevotellaceae bacterium]|jgi:phosphatidylserine decarboxylase|nr:phosphatidylserine decarboxylase family protein [Prevotellaceae bacterium]